MEHGAKVIVEKEDRPVVLIQPATRPGRLLSESIARAEKYEQELGYAPRLDGAFGNDLEEIIASHQEPLTSRWD